jgi:hypothetical protein
MVKYSYDTNKVRGHQLRCIKSNGKILSIKIPDINHLRMNQKVQEHMERARKRKIYLLKKKARRHINRRRNHRSTKKSTES